MIETEIVEKMNEKMSSIVKSVHEIASERGGELSSSSILKNTETPTL